MKSLISILLFGLLTQTTFAAISKKDCKKACETCMKCSPAPTVLPTPKPPVSSLDLKLLSLSPSGGTIKVTPSPVPSSTKFLFGNPKISMIANEPAHVKITAEIGKVDPVTHQLLTPTLKSSAGFQALAAGIETAGNISPTIPVSHGVNVTYKITMCVVAVDINSPTKAEIPESNLGNNCLSGEYLIVD